MITQKVYLCFPRTETDKPLVYLLIRNFNLTVNIIRARVTPEEEGYLSLEISGTKENCEKAYAFLHEMNVIVHVGNKGVHWDEERCTHCGNCTAHCPTGALDFADRTTRTIRFNEEQCVECLACLTNCPFGVCTTTF